MLEAGGGVLIDSKRRKHLVVYGGYISNSGLRTTRHAYALRLGVPNGAWRRLRDMPTDATHTAQAIAGSTLYMCGGFAGTAPGRTIKECWRYDVNRAVWERLRDLPEARGGGGMVYVKRKGMLVYAGGTLRGKGQWSGVDRGECWSLHVWRKGAAWQRRRDMPNPRNHMAGVSVGGRFLFLGGQHLNLEHSANQADVHEYLVSKDAWVRRKSMPRGLGHVSASSFAYWNGVLVMGGIGDGRTLRDEILYYDLFKDEWSFVGRLPRRVQGPICDKFGKRLACATGAGKPGTGRDAFMRRVSLPM